MAGNGTGAPTVLVVDDEKNIRIAVQVALAEAGIRAITAHDAASGLRALRGNIVDVLILDIRLNDQIDGLGFFRKMQTDGLATPVIFISGAATLTEATRAVKMGAFDFVEKPFSAERIGVAVRRCLEFSMLRERVRLAEMREGPAQIVGDSPGIRKVIAEALRVAGTNANVLIAGESGTGKELLANMIHQHSERRAAPFVKVNCSAIPESLAESELFGHERGAFTGAAGARRGLFEVAHHGSIFLDEVADLALPTQAKILRVVQSGEIQRVGSDRAMTVDARILCGTHKDLRKAVAEGRFREDLYYRLNVVPLRLPSLRERPEDVPLLVRALAGRLCEKNNIREKPIDDEVLTELMRYHWPGNVRELENVLERVIIMSGDRVTVSNLPEEIVAAVEPAEESASSALKAFRDEAERGFIIAALKRHEGNISQTAAELGIGRTYLHRRLTVLQISKKDWLS